MAAAFQRMHVGGTSSATWLASFRKWKSSVAHGTHHKPTRFSYPATNRSGFQLSCPSVHSNHRLLDYSLSPMGIVQLTTFHRTYSSDEKRSLPTVMDFPNIVWPSVFKTIKNWIMVHFIIRPYFDQDFNMPDFVRGSKQAIEVVSASMGQLDTDSLSGLVASDAIDELRGSIARMSAAQRSEIAINKEDIYLSFPYQVGVMFDETNDVQQKRWVEITMVVHVLRGLQDMRANGIVPPLNIGAHPEYRNRISICNYRFIKEFTQGQESDWTINVANHFKPADELEDDE